MKKADTKYSVLNLAAKPPRLWRKSPKVLFLGVAFAGFALGSTAILHNTQDGIGVSQHRIESGIVSKLSKASPFFVNEAAADSHLPKREPPRSWRWEWTETDFTKANVEWGEIMSGGPPKDGIPSIDKPVFSTIAEQKDVLGATEPVMTLTINGDTRAYPLRILMWHEIVNDVVGGKAVAVTYCPLCNAAIVFDPTVNGEPSEFGTTGKLRNSDMVMYDRNTESWWQQFTGEGIVGSQTGTVLKTIPSRLESFERFAERHPEGKVLIPNAPGMRQYGMNPYTGYDSLEKPFLYNGEMPDGIPALARVIAIGEKAWSLAKLREAGSIMDGDLELSWTEGQNSALDSRAISKGKDVGNVVVQRTSSDGKKEDVFHDITFAFVFHAFRPEGELIF